MSMERMKNLFSWPFSKFFSLLVGFDIKKKKKKRYLGTAREARVEVGNLYWPGSLRAVPPVCSSIH